MLAGSVVTVCRLKVQRLGNINAIRILLAAIEVGVVLQDGPGNGAVAAILLDAPLGKGARLVSVRCRDHPRLRLVCMIARAVVLDERVEPGELVEPHVGSGKVQLSPCGSEDGVQRGSFQAPVNTFRGAIQRAATDVHAEAKDEKHEEDDSGMNVGREEGCLEATMHGVDPARQQRDEECRPDGRHPGQVADGRRSAQQQHGCDNHVGHEREANHDAVRDCAKTCLHYLHEGVHVRGTALHLDGEDREEQNLHSGAGRVPEGP
mmetsp:Transcript_89404/g.278189  ORF Transcript_89404/g.278189 Transcript_89404/m.278189 type:complete len:263 (-) Transcript_89404:416-1204(-)